MPRVYLLYRIAGGKEYYCGNTLAGYRASTRGVLTMIRERGRAERDFVSNYSFRIDFSADKKDLARVSRR